MARESVHAEPVWRDRSNFIIGADLLEEGHTEQLWARQVGDRRFEICCVPFFLYDVALGDLVETDENYSLARVVEPSGRYVFRAHFSGSSQPREEVVERLTEFGALSEWSSVSLLAIDASDWKHAQQVADFLQERQDQGQLIYETGKSA